MRIDNHLLITGDNRTDTGDMMSRLETGDVISARVLEISPKEAVLRLSDGTVIKAGTTESLDVKPGQTISLSVTSRNENSIVLETVKDTSRATAENTADLQKMLKAAGVKLDNINIKLAAEFMKYGSAPTAENIAEALEFMKGPDGLDVEKAVFLAVKNISSAQADKDMLAGLLSGNLKLGHLLESMYKVLNGEGKRTDAGSINQNAAAIPPASDTLPDTANRSAQQTDHSASAAAGNSIPADKTSPSASESASTEVKSSVMPSDAQTGISSSGSNTANASINAQSAMSQKEAADVLNAPEENRLSSEAAFIQSNHTSANDTEAKSSDSPKAGVNTEINADPYTELNDASKRDSVNSSIQKQSDSVPKSAFTAGGNVNETTRHSQTPDISSAIQDIAAGTKNINVEASDMKQFRENSSEEALKRINDSIERIYIDINKQLTGEELDSGGNIKNRLSELSRELNLLMHSSADSKAVNMQAASALNLVEDTVRLLDMFNSNNVLYYQIPVKIDNYKSTAELYVMKRHQSKKRIDPNDSVLFLSLDTKNLGRIETILDVKGRNISMSLRTETQSASDFARAHIKNLYSALSECGYKLADIKYAIAGAAATPVQQENLLADAVKLKHGKVDFRI